MFEALKARLKQHEGVIAWIYLDSLGIATTGVGHALFTAAYAVHLPFTKLSSLIPASSDDILAEYNAVRQLKPDELPGYYEARTTLRLSGAAIDNLLDQDVVTLQHDLTAYLPGLPSYPAPAQEALLDMAFQLGAHGLVEKFPHMIADVMAQNWPACADNCHREGIAEWRNEATQQLFLQA
jgi:GH24 family phage-related lysozyme (muramidase)